MKIYETTEDLKSGNLSSIRTRAVSVARRFVGGLPVFLALTIAAQAQTSGPASYQDRSDAALHRRQLAGMTQDLAALKDLVNKLQFDLQDVQRENQTLRQKVVELQRVQVSTPARTALDTVGMEKILSAMRAQSFTTSVYGSENLRASIAGLDEASTGLAVATGCVGLINDQ